MFPEGRQEELQWAEPNLQHAGHNGWELWELHAEPTAALQHSPAELKIVSSLHKI